MLPRSTPQSSRAISNPKTSGAAVPITIQIALLLRACHTSSSVNISWKLASPMNGGLELIPSKSTTE
jgi:hypothetical protein